MGQPHISLAAEKIGQIGNLPITNSILMTWLVMGFLAIFAYLVTRHLSLVPSGFQSLVEVVVEGLFNLFKSVVGETYVHTFFPLLATIFLFIAIANWSGLLPGVGTIGLFEGKKTAGVQVVPAAYALTTPVTSVVEKVAGVEKVEIEVTPAETHQAKFVPLFRGPTADLNTTLAIALVAVFSIQYYGVKTLGLAYLKKFINLSNPIMFGVGILEIISEFSRVISFSFRLFGNIFAGEVLLTVIAFLMPIVAPLPFLGLELFIGFIQALVFSMLTAVFLNMATVSHEGH